MGGRFLAFLIILHVQLALCFDRFDYSDALRKSLLYFEGVRSGPVEANQRVYWRGPSGLTDGYNDQVDLVGGFYDAGDNVKFGLPMAFTTTMLSWSIIEGRKQLALAGELRHAMRSLRWATDYLLKTYHYPDKLFVQVGDGNKDHSCWERPEDMDTDRTVYSIDPSKPGSDVAGETAAALAAASIVFKRLNPEYSATLLAAAKNVFEFADKYRGKYSDSIPAVEPFYKSYGYEDELLWGATWLYYASKDVRYLQYVIDNGAAMDATTSTYVATSWDNKLPGLQVLLSRIFLKTHKSIEDLQPFKKQADEFVCSVMPGNPKTKVSFTLDGLLYVQYNYNLQFVTSNAFVLLTYAKYLKDAGETVSCDGYKTYYPEDLTAFAKKQVDYILGDNPKQLSYMVGFGNAYPRHIHHRASSLPSTRDHPEKISCSEGFNWIESAEPNPNVLVGAIVGGPDLADEFADSRHEYARSEPATYITAPMVGACALLLQLEAYSP